MVQNPFSFERPADGVVRNSADSFTHTETVSYSQKVGNSFKGMIAGILLPIVAAGVLWFGEKNHAETVAALAEIREKAVAADATGILPEGPQPVYVAGEMASASGLSSEDFSIVATGAVRLERTVEAYLWKEKKHTSTTDNADGSQTKKTTYDYEKGWSKEYRDSSSFVHPEGHSNPVPAKKPGVSTSNASDAKIGTVALSSDLVDSLETGWSKLPVTEVPQVATTGTQATVSGSVVEKRWSVSPDGYGYFGISPDVPEIGDVRVSFRAILPQKGAAIGLVKSGTLSEYVARNGKSVPLIEAGEVSSEGLLGHAEERDTFIVWILRIVGTVLMIAGISALLAPIRAILSIVPVFSSLADLSVGFVSFLVGSFLSSVVIAVAWFAYRPVSSLALVATVGGAALLFGLVFRKKSEPKTLSADSVSAGN